MSSLYKCEITTLERNGRSIFTPGIYVEKSAIMMALEEGSEDRFKYQLENNKDPCTSDLSRRGLHAALMYTARFGLAQSFLALINSVDCKVQRRLLQDHGNMYLVEVKFRWRNTLSCGSLIINVPDCHKYLDIMIYLFNISYNLEGCYGFNYFSKSFCQREILNLIAESGFCDSLYLEPYLRPSNRFVIDKYMDMKKTTIEDSSAYLNIQDRLYYRYCNVILVEMIETFRSSSFRSLHVRRINSIINMIYSYNLINHLNKKIIGDVVFSLDLSKGLIESGNFSPNILMLSSPFQKALSCNINVAKYYEHINFLTKSDIYNFPWTSEETEKDDEKTSLLAKLRRVPTLYRIVLVTVSSLIGPQQHRKCLVSKLDIPPALQRALTFQLTE